MCVCSKKPRIYVMKDLNYKKKETYRVGSSFVHCCYCDSFLTICCLPPLPLPVTVCQYCRVYLRKGKSSLEVSIPGYTTKTELVTNHFLIALNITLPAEHYDMTCFGRLVMPMVPRLSGREDFYSTLLLFSYLHLYKFLSQT